MCSAQGFCLAVKNILETKKRGFNWFGIVCSSWIWMNRGTSKRTALSPLGGTSKLYICQANLMTSRVILLIWLALSCHQCCVIEQPSSSLLSHHPRLQDLFMDYVIYEIRISLGHFGAPTKKPVVLWCTHEWLDKLKLKGKVKCSEAYLPTVISYVDKKGEKKCCGGPGLKGTQTYPYAFGDSIAQLYKRHMMSKSGARVVRARAQMPIVTDVKTLINKHFKGKAAWSDAELLSAMKCPCYVKSASVYCYLLPYVDMVLYCHIWLYRAIYLATRARMCRAICSYASLLLRLARYAKKH